MQWLESNTRSCYSSLAQEKIKLALLKINIVVVVIVLVMVVKVEGVVSKVVVVAV